jgi:hypothetical protein
VQAWQASPDVHPLTCGNESSHRLLVAEKRGRKVVLTCPDCDYLQDWIPNVVIEAGSRMKPGPPRGPQPQSEPAIPPIGESFADGIEKLLKAKPPNGKQRS